MTTDPLPPIDLTATDLNFGFPGRPLFADWSHRFPAGLTWVQGENGCGKSTLLRLLGGALQPASGSLSIGPTDARREPLAYRREVFWCGPDGVAFDHLTPREYLGFIAGLFPRFDGAAIEPLKEAFGLQPFFGQPIRQLSTGTQRKVALLAAFACNSTAVLLDEPLAALDQASVAVLHDLLAQASIQRERLWIVTSHESLGARAVATAHRLTLPHRT